MTDDLLARLTAALADRYAVERELGRGGMATVYLAQDLKHHRPVAIKVLTPELARALGAERFLREIEVAAQLDHPHILALYDSGEADEFLYYVMPYVEGESLRERLEREKQLPLEDALQVAREVAEALGYAHSHGVIHRDIKPENILLAGGHARVADFGIAKAVTAAGSERLTETGLSIGTPAYMSPEQGAGSQDLDGRSDLYSLGCVLHEMLAGEPPYTGPSAQAVIAKRLSEPLPRISVVREAVPAAVEQALTKALAKVPADRFPTAEHFTQALIREEPPEPRARPWKKLAVGVAAVAGLAGLAYWATTGDRPPTSAEQADLNRVVVFPFDVHAGADRAWLGEAAMELLGDALDGAGALRRVDPLALISRLRKTGNTRAVTDDRARELARHFGAGRFVAGGVWDVGREVRITAALFDAAGGLDPLARGSATGGEADLQQLVDSVTVQLLRQVPLGTGTRLANVSTVQTENFEALKAYLQGERLFRHGWFDSAGLKFQEAVERDSTFALAWYRLARAQGWGAEGDNEASIDRALRYAARLPARDSLLVEARHAFQHGDGRRAEEVARLVVGMYPDDVDAWALLHETRGAYPWQLGRPWHERASDRVLELDPTYPTVVTQRAWRAARDGDLPLADSLLRAAARGGGAGAVYRSAKAAVAVQRGDGEAVLERARTEDDWTVWMTGYTLLGTDSMRWAGDLWRRLAEDPNRAVAHRGRVQVDLALLDLARGRWHAASRAFRNVHPSTQALATIYAAWFAAMPGFERPAAELRQRRDEMQRMTVPPAGSAVLSSIGLTVPAILQPHVQPYLTGLLSALLGDRNAALAAAELLESVPESRDSTALLADLAREIRALEALQRGSVEEAVAILTEMELRAASFGDLFSPFHRRLLGRQLLADALYRAGRYRDAADWFGTCLEVIWGPDYAQYALASLGQARSYEQLGDTTAALDAYRRFLQWWQEPDPEYHQLVREVEEHLAQLQRDRG